MEGKAFGRDMSATHKRVSFTAAPGNIAVGGFVLGLSVATLVFLILVVGPPHWLLMFSLVSLTFAAIILIHYNHKVLKSAEDSRG